MNPLFSMLPTHNAEGEPLSLRARMRYKEHDRISGERVLFVHVEKVAATLRLYVTARIESYGRCGLAVDGELTETAYSRIPDLREAKRRVARLRRNLERAAQVAPLGDSGIPGIVLVDHRKVGNGSDLFYRDMDFVKQRARAAAAAAAAAAEKVRRQRATRRRQLAKVKLRGGQHRVALYQPPMAQIVARIPAERIERTQAVDWTGASDVRTLATRRPAQLARVSLTEMG